MSPKHASSDPDLKAVTRDQEWYSETVFQLEELNERLERVLGFLDRLDVPTKAKE
jgi:hypothetical protein